STTYHGHGSQAARQAWERLWQRSLHPSVPCTRSSDCPLRERQKRPQFQMSSSCPPNCSGWGSLLCRTLAKCILVLGASHPNDLCLYWRFTYEGQLVSVRVAEFNEPQLGRVGAVNHVRACSKGNAPFLEGLEYRVNIGNPEINHGPSLARLVRLRDADEQ